MAKFTMTTGEQLHDLTYTLEFMGQTYEQHFTPDNDGDGYISAEEMPYYRIMRNRNCKALPMKVLRALGDIHVGTNIGNINRAIQVLSAYEHTLGEKGS